MDLKQCLTALCGAAGAGGMDDAALVAADFLREFAGEVRLDTLGSVTAVRRCGKEKAPLLLLEAHIDEIGFIVTGTDKKGFIHVDKCGGADDRALPAADVIVWADKPYPGVFGSTPPHLAGGADKLPAVPDMGIDLGLDPKQAKKKIKPGARVTFRPEFRTLCGTRVSSKALDDRAGAASILFCLDLLREEALSWDIAVALAVQEELGCRGSAVAAFAAAPDRAIAVDVSFAVTPDANPAKCGVMGKGPMVGYAPGLDKGMSRRLTQLAADAGIPAQREIMGGDTGTDADAIASSRAGVPTALLSIPLKYMHTPAEVVDLTDVENTGRLMAEYIRKEAAV